MIINLSSQLVWTILYGQVTEVGYITGGVTKEKTTGLNGITRKQEGKFQQTEELPDP